jgi:hypothetical protein
MHRVRTGAAEPPSWFWSSPGEGLGGAGRESRFDTAEKRLLRATATRTGRARRFVAERVLPSPGHLVAARDVFHAYLTWARDHEPDEPLSYGAFLAVLQDRAPTVARRAVRRPRGRPALAFAGITTTPAGPPRAGLRSPSK